MFGVLGNEALGRRAEPEIDDTADQHHPGPGIDVDAEFEAAEPARHHDLRQEGEQGADDANDESGAGETPGDRGVAAVGDKGAQPRHGAAQFHAP